MTDIPSEVPPVQVRANSCLDTTSRALLTLALLIVAGVAVAFLLIALPANDDFIRATQPSQTHQNFWALSSFKLFFKPIPALHAANVPVGSGFWNYFLYLYFSWQGRWVSYGIEAAILPRGDMTRIYPALIGVVAIVNLLGLFAVCRFFTRSASRWFSLACTFSVAAVLWAMMPSLAQTVHWFVGGVENVTPLALAGVLLVGLCRLRASVPWMIFASLLAIVTTGLHEAYGAMLCIALAVGTVAGFWMGSANRNVWLVALIAATVGLGIVFIAPGNRVRMAKDVSHHVRHLSVILKLTGKQLWNSGRQWLFDPKLLAAALFVAFSPGLEKARPVWITAGRVPWRLLIPVTWLAMLFVGFFMPSYAFVDVMPGRTLSGNFIVFAVGWLIIVFIFTRNLEARDSTDKSFAGLRSSAATSVAMLVLAASLVLSGNTMDAIHDLGSRQVLHWRASVEARYAMLRKPGEPDQIIPRLAPSSRLLYSGEIWTDPANWTNFSLSDYFHRKGLRVLPVGGKDATTLPVGDGENASQNM